jgi:hypothetical protein
MLSSVSAWFHHLLRLVFCDFLIWQILTYTMLLDVFANLWWCWRRWWCRRSEWAGLLHFVQKLAILPRPAPRRVGRMLRCPILIRAGMRQRRRRKRKKKKKQEEKKKRKAASLPRGPRASSRGGGSVPRREHRAGFSAFPSPRGRSGRGGRHCIRRQSPPGGSIGSRAVGF